MTVAAKLVAVTPRYFDSTSLGAVALKSYAQARWVEAGQPIRPIELDRFFCEQEPDEIVAALAAGSPGLIGFSVYPWNFGQVKDVVARLKRRRPDSLIVLGGPSVCFQAPQVLADLAGADLIVLGPGEETFFQLLADPDNFAELNNIVYRDDDRIIENPYRLNVDISRHAYPLLTDDLAGLKVVNYETSRGCFFRCKYCAWNVGRLEPTGVRHYPTAKVKADLANLYRLPDLERLILNDSNITFEEDRCLDLFGQLRELQIQRRQDGLPPVRLTLDFNPQYLTERTIKAIARLNVGVVGFGLQSLDREVLARANRRFDQEAYVKNLGRVSQAGLQFIIELIFGLPGDDLAKFRRSVEFVLSDLRAHSLMCFRFALLPGSPFWEERDKYDLAVSDQPPHRLVASNTFPKEDLDRADLIACWLDIFFSVFRSVKKTVEQRTLAAGRPMLPVYEHIFDRLTAKYGDFFQFGLRQEVSHYYFDKLRDRANSPIRREMMADARRILGEAIDKEPN